MKIISLSDNIMFSIILIAFFYLNNDIKGCCSKSKIKRNERNLVDETIFYEDEDWSKIYSDNKANFGEIQTEEFYKHLGNEYFKNIDSNKIDEKNKKIKQYIFDLKDQIVINIEKTLEFNDNKEYNKEKSKKELFQIVIKGSECVTDYKGTKIYGLKQYLEDVINDFFKKKGFKDYFLLAYILFKVNKNIVKLLKNESKKSLDEIIENLNYKEIIQDKGTKKIGKFKFRDKNGKITNKEFVLDFNDIDLYLSSSCIFNRVKYCFLVYLILITNEIFDKFPFLVKINENTIGVDVLQNIEDNVSLSYLLKKMLKGKKVNLDIYLKIARTKFNVVKNMYQKIYNISIPIFSENSKLILKFDDEYFKNKKYFIDKKNNKEEYKKIIDENIKESCKKYKEFYEYSKGNSNELHSYIKKIFETKLKYEDKKDITIYNLFKDYDNLKDNFDKTNVVFKLKEFTKIKITELTQNYEKIYIEEKK